MVKWDLWSLFDFLNNQKDIDFESIFECYWFWSNSSQFQVVCEFRNLIKIDSVNFFATINEVHRVLLVAIFLSFKALFRGHFDLIGKSFRQMWQSQNFLLRQNFPLDNSGHKYNHLFQTEKTAAFHQNLPQIFSWAFIQTFRLHFMH